MVERLEDAKGEPVREDRRSSLGRVVFRKTAKKDAQPPYRAVSEFELPERGAVVEVVAVRAVGTLKINRCRVPCVEQARANGGSV